MSVLITQSFGNEAEYRRAIFSIWSYRVYCDERIILFTDAPEFFEPFFKDQPIEYILLTKDKIKQMRGKIDFLHRMKIALIEEAFTLANDNLLYLDSDTFFVGDPTPLMSSLAKGKAFMHLNEYRFDSLSQMKLPAAKPFHAFLDLIKNSRFTDSNGISMSISPLQYSWNAGVMMLHLAHAEYLSDVYALTDQFYPQTQNHASEQYAFSIVLQSKTKLSQCDSVVYHYWYRIKKQIMDAFLLIKINNNWANMTADRKRESVRQWSRELPNYFDTHLLSLRDNAIQAFHENNFYEGYKNAWKAFLKSPFSSMQFVRNVLYHVKRHLITGKVF